MPALSFGRKWIDPLLQHDKQKTTRPQTKRFKVGDVAHIYIEQRRPITSKPMRRVTQIGQDMVISKILAQKYPAIPDRLYLVPEYYAHFLGKVQVTEVYDIHPCEMSGEELEVWAWADGFEDITSADVWFTAQYDSDWMQRWWTVVGWHGWIERYLEAPNGKAVCEGCMEAHTRWCDHHHKGVMLEECVLCRFMCVHRPGLQQSGLYSADMVRRWGAAEIERFQDSRKVV